MLFLWTLLLSINNMITIPYFNTVPAIDGEILQNEWNNTFVIDSVFTQITPAFGEKMADSTTIKMGYDENALYVLFICYQDTSSLISQKGTRDKSFSQDFVGIEIDPMDTKQEIYSFIFGLSGGLNDSRKLRNEGWDDWSWDGDVSYVVKRTSFGYVVEAKIPFSDFRRRKGSLKWGINFIRKTQYNDQLGLSFPLIDTSQELFETLLSVKMDKAKGKENVYLMPYGIWGKIYDDTLTTNYGDAGFDLKIPVFSSGVANISFNPDFNQLEGDPLEFDFNSKNPVYYQEYRPFFLEEKNVFSLSSKLYYSRQIKNPFIAARYTYKDPQRSMGVIVAKDEYSEEYLSEDADVGIVRYIEQIGESNIGIINITRYEDSTGYINEVIGQDANIRLNNGFTLEYVAAISFYSDSLFNWEDKGIFYKINPTYKKGGFFVYGEAEGISQNYNNTVGYLPYDRTQNIGGGSGYSKNLKNGILNKWGINFWTEMEAEYDKFETFVTNNKDSLNLIGSIHLNASFFSCVSLSFSSNISRELYANKMFDKKGFSVFSSYSFPKGFFFMGEGKYYGLDYTQGYLGISKYMFSSLSLIPIDVFSFNIKGNYSGFYADERIANGDTIYPLSYTDIENTTWQWKVYSITFESTYSPSNEISFALTYQRQIIKYADWYWYVAYYGTNEITEDKLFGIITYKPSLGNVIYFGGKYPERLIFFKFSHRMKI